MRRRLVKGWIVSAVSSAVVSTACRSAPPPIPPLTVSKETIYITEPLRADGTPDYAAWLNREYGSGVTPENNAALVLRSGLEPGVQLDPAAFAAQQRRAFLAPWLPPDAPLIAAWLRANDGNLARIDETTRTRTRYWVPLPGELGFDMKLPSLLGSRHAANAFRVRALESAARGDSAAARGDVVAGLRLGALLEQGPWLVDRLIAVAVRGIAAEAIVALANPPPVEPGAARALLEELKQVPESVPLDDVLDVNERLVFLAGYVDLYRAGRTSPRAWEERMASIVAAQEQVAASLGQPAPSPVWKKFEAWAIDWDELLSTLNRCWQNPACEGEIAAARADLEPAAFDGLMAHARSDKEARRRLARAFLGLEESRSLLRASIAWNEAEAIVRSGLVSAAAGVFKVEHGRYPTDPRDLDSAGFDPSADHAGYSFTYEPSADGSRFAYTASPQRSGDTGVRGFCADSSGRLAFASDGTPPAVVAGLCDLAAQALVARTPPAIE